MPPKPQRNWARLTASRMVTALCTRIARAMSVLSAIHTQPNTKKPITNAPMPITPIRYGR